jgi:outer membrane protein assembly factor BamD (BamD/ComL family)
LTPVLAPEKTDGPTNEKAQKTYKEAVQSLHENRKESAVEGFKKADKQDDEHGLACRSK